jgi:glycosyltransferase involved in cell wall biosynthesis
MLNKTNMAFPIGAMLAILKRSLTTDLEPMNVDASSDQAIRVFVHLPHGYDAATWNRKWKEGRILGINEPFPYGYHLAERMGCSVCYSQDCSESKPAQFLRLGMRAILGFDLVHAWRNFKDMQRADVIWTHTESPFLAILLLFQLNPNIARPKLIAQSVWLFDQWYRFSKMRRSLFSRLIRKADILTVLSPDNLQLARQLFPKVRSELVLFGIAADTKIAPTLRQSAGSLNIVSLGNDRHRDWTLLIDAVRGQRNWTLKIASQKVRPSAVANLSNVEVVNPQTNDELLSLYKWADILALAIKPNLHASGITVIQEAALQGLPVVCSNVGGLGAYFSDSEIWFVPPENVTALREAIDGLASNPAVRLAFARKAQDRMGPRGLSSESFVKRHVEISRELLSRP